MRDKKEPYRYDDNASIEMLIKLLITPDGRGTKDKKLALKKIIEKADWGEFTSTEIEGVLNEL